MGRKLLIFILLISGCGFNAQIADLKSSLESSIDGSIGATPTPVPTQQTVSAIVNQNSTQPDPTSSFPIKFIISFIDPIDPSTLDNNDVQFSGTAGTVAYNVVPVGDDKNFYVEVTSTSQTGTIQLITSSLSVLSAQGVPNDTPVIIDNSVSLIAASVPYMFKNLNQKQAGTDLYLRGKVSTDQVVFDQNGTQSKFVNLQTKNVSNQSASKADYEKYYYIGEMSGVVFYAGYNNTVGRELWRTDGTDAGTYLVKDIYSGTSDSYPFYDSSSAFTQFDLYNPSYNGYVYFIATESTGAKIWRTDGTAAGTQAFFEASPGLTESHYNIIGELNGKFYFSAVTPTNGNELYYTMGVPGDQVMVELRSGSNSGFSRSTLGPAKQNGQIYFDCDKGTSTGLEPCVSDGTFAGTTMIKDIFGGAVSSYSTTNPYNNGISLLSGNTNISGTKYSLWVSDGTSANTFLHPVYGSNFDGVTPLNKLDYTGKDYVYLIFHHEIDGEQLYIAKPEGTGFTLLKDLIDVSTVGQSFVNIDKVAMNNGKLIFIAQTTSDGSEIWATDGTVGGTALVKDINPGAADGVMGYFYTTLDKNIIAFNNELYFVGMTASGGNELWKSDGTSAGTVMVKDISPGTTSSNPSEFFVENGYLYFSADDGLHGKELWRTDGTTAGTVLHIDFTLGELTSGDPNTFLEMNGKLFFIASDTNLGEEVFVTDGTFANTQVLKDLNPGQAGANIEAFFVDNNKLMIVSADNPTGHATLFISDGTSAGTNILNSDFGINGWSHIDKTGSGISYFLGSNASRPFGLWRSDYTLGGTYELTTAFNTDFSNFILVGKLQDKYLLKDYFLDNWLINDGTVVGTSMFTNVASDIGWSIETPNGLFFEALNPTVGRELFKFDGSMISVVHDIMSGVGDSDARLLGNLGNDVLFVASNNSSEAALYKTDGTTLTKLLVINTTMADLNLGEFFTKDGKIYFSAASPANGQEVWLTDGTIAGSSLLKDINVGVGNSNSSLFFQHGTGFYFKATDGTTGSELWYSDGTSAGTVLVKDIRPGSSGSSIGSFVSVGSRVFFVANDGTHGKEIWSTNGTSAGTNLYYDLATGSATYNPVLEYLFGDQLFFSAEKPGEGRELWVIPDVN